MHRSFQNVDVDDEDGIRFRTAGGARADVTLRLDDAPMLGKRLLVGGSDQPQVDRAVWRLDPRDGRLALPFPRLPAPVKDGQLRAVLAFVQRPPAPLATMSEKTRESLRALGYIE